MTCDKCRDNNQGDEWGDLKCDKAKFFCAKHGIKLWVRRVPR